MFFTGPGKFDQSHDYWTQATYLIERRLTMKNCAGYILCAISLFLTLSLIFDAFADDDRWIMANCAACHITAEQGIYDDDDVKIPK